MTTQPTFFTSKDDLQCTNSTAPIPVDNKVDDMILKKEIRQLLKQRNAVMVAHYYTDESIQQLAEDTGGCVSDSLEMARFGRDHSAATLIVAGVRFMGETAKILSPTKQVLMPTLEATCSLDESAPETTFIPFCDQHPDRTVVVYANTRAIIKARADWVVTSSNAVAVIKHLHENGEKILWAPDKHLGHYIQDQTGADLLIWDGACVVHESFKATALAALKKQRPQAAILVHPESPMEVIRMADVVGSTSVLISAVKELPNTEFIVATEPGIFYKMREQAPGKHLIVAPTAGRSATCESCAHCPWMKMNTLARVKEALLNGTNEIVLDKTTQINALKATERMLSFRAA